MNEYNQYIDENDDSIYIDTLNDKLLNIINCFYHILKNHNDNDNEFKYIYHLFGADCKLSNCRKIRRNFRKERNDKIKQNLLQNNLDIIHAHYNHVLLLSTSMTYIATMNFKT